MKAEQVTVRRVGIGLAVAAALLTSACAAGQYAQTAAQPETLDGISVKVGAITLGGLAIQTPADGTSYPVGSDAPVRVVIVNSGGAPDTLTSITSPSITGWGAFGSSADAAAVQAARSEASAPVSSVVPSSSASSSGSSSSTATGSPSTSASASPSSASPSASASSAPPLPAPKTSITVPAESRVSFGVPDTKAVLLLTGLKTRLWPGMTISVTFTFDRAGTVTVQVPVQLSKTPQTSVIPAPSTTGQPG